MSSVRVLLFATLRQLAGAKAIEIEIPDGMNVGAFKEKVGRDFPALKPSMGTVLIAINREFAFDDAIVPAGGEIALFPPVSGG
jgi:molybdopterin converting factor subunit 1